MADTRALNRRYRLIGWGALLSWIGAASFLPGERLPFGVGLLGIGVILVGIALARTLIHEMPLHWVDMLLGAMALALGAAELLRSWVPVSVAVVVSGVALFIRGARPRKDGLAAGSCPCW